VRVTTRDGVVHTGRVDYAKGEPENMLTDSEFEAKFRRLVGDLVRLSRIATQSGRGVYLWNRVG